MAVRRGSSGNAPLVGSVTNRQGDPLAKPVRRDTTLADFNIVGLASAQHLRVKLMPHRSTTCASNPPIGDSPCLG